jgi:nucleoside 2-deoxyribosyltransferase
MAFGYADADAIYTAVEKALSPMLIKLVRVDRIEHNDDIDDRIITEIHRADFVLADLTYARPSVYFEAGYAQRAVPVIYTVRRDHFKDKPDDPNGNLRVHFDLQMRNIISWSGTGDRAFLKRLKARITKVVAPILAVKSAEAAQKRDTADFNRLSVQDKRKVLSARLKSTSASSAIKSSDFSPKTNLRIPRYHEFPRHFGMESLHKTDFRRVSVCDRPYDAIDHQGSPRCLSDADRLPYLQQSRIFRRQHTSETHFGRLCYLLARFRRF